MTYYRIMQYCIKNGMPPAQADYMRKLVRRLVNETMAAGDTAHRLYGSAADGRYLDRFQRPVGDPKPILTVAMIRECERQLKAVECSPAEAVQYSDFRGLTEMLKEDLQSYCLGCAEGNEPFHGYHYFLDRVAEKCPRQEQSK